MRRLAVTPLMFAIGYLHTLRDAGHRLVRLEDVWCFIPRGRPGGVPDDAFVSRQIEHYLQWREIEVGDAGEASVADVLAEVKKLLA